MAPKTTAIRHLAMSAVLTRQQSHCPYIHCPMICTAAVYYLNSRTLLYHIQESQEKGKASLLGWEAKFKCPRTSVKTEGKDNVAA